MEALGRFELPTCGLGNRCSIHLSYRANTSKCFILNDFISRNIVVLAVRLLPAVKLQYNNAGICVLASLVIAERASRESSTCNKLLSIRLIYGAL